MRFSPLTGLVVAVVVLVAATVFALVRRRRDGTFRTVADPAPIIEPTVGAAPRRAAPVGAPPGGTAPAPDRDEPNRDEPNRDEPDESAVPAVLAELGVTAGTPVTLLQFSSAFCAPCRATRVVCQDVAARVPGVRHLEVDAEAHLDAVRALRVMRTPTLFVIDSSGRVRRRASGQPSRAQLLAAVADVLDVSVS